MRITWIVVSALSFVFLFSTLYAAPNQPVTRPLPIKIGTSVDLSGINKHTGESIKTGLEMYFHHVNAQGGIDGRPLVLITLNDEYQPELASANVRKLINDEKVLALIGNLGIANVLTCLPIITELKTVLFGPLAGFALSNPPQRYLFNYMTNYDQLQVLILKPLLKAGYKDEDFAFFIQENGSGNLIYKSSVKAFHALGIDNIAAMPLGVYNPNTLNVENAFSEIITQSAPRLPGVIFMAGISAANERFIKLAAKELANSIFVTETALIPPDHLSPDVSGRVIHVKGSPYYNSNIPIAKAYLEDSKRYAKPVSDESFIMYATAALLVQALKHASAHHHLSKEGIIDELEALKNVDIGLGVNISFSKNNHQALNSEWSEIFIKGKYQQLDWITFKKLTHLKHSGKK